MNLSKILSISGKNGLFKLISQSKNSVIVESLEDGHRFPVFAQEGIATLDNITIFTDNDDVSLSIVLQNIFKKEDGAAITIAGNDANALKTFFAEILPEYDRSRVYVSNIKKIIAWYNILINHNLIDLETENSEKKPEEPNEENA